VKGPSSRGERVLGDFRVLPAKLLVIVIWVSCSATSRLALARTTPVRPPIVNRAMNPSAHSIGTVILRLPPYAVASQEKILIPVGTAMIIVAAVK
jgi:hypothetical protein